MSIDSKHSHLDKQKQKEIYLIKQVLVCDSGGDTLRKFDDKQLSVDQQLANCINIIVDYLMFLNNPDEIEFPRQSEFGWGLIDKLTMLQKALVINSMDKSRGFSETFDDISD